jgi:hypothetical protein
MNQGGLDLPLHMKSRSTTHHLQGAQGWHLQCAQNMIEPLP